MDSHHAGKIVVKAEPRPMEDNFAKDKGGVDSGPTISSIYVQSAELGWSVNDEEKRVDGYGRKSKGDLIEGTKQRPQGSRV